MDKIRIIELPVDINMQRLMKKMNFKSDSPVYDEYQNAVALLKKQIKPMAIIKACPIETFSKNFVVMDGIKYKSKTLYYLLKDHQQVFLYLLTIGEMPSNLHHIEHYFLQSLKLPIMYGAMKHLKAAIREDYHLKQVGIANPGLIQDWAIQDSKAIFESFGDSTRKIGLEMSKGYIMRPVYSSSGILFDDFQNYCDCTVCSVDGCIAREEKMINDDDEMISVG